MTFMAIILALIAVAPAFLYLVGRIRDPFHPLIFMGLTAYFLVPSYFLTRHEEVMAFLSPEIYTQFLIVCGISLLGLYMGWAYSEKKTANPRDADVSVAVYDPARMILLAVIFICVSIPVHFFYTIKFDKSLSGYLIEINKLWCPAAILLVQAYFLVGRHSRPWICVLLLISLIPPLERAWSYGQRGDLLRVAAVFSLFYFNSFKRPSKPVFIVGITVVGLMALTLHLTRELVGSGEAPNRAAAMVEVIPSYIEGRFKTVNNGSEFIFGAAEVETVRVLGEYGWGRTYTVGIIGRALPRQFFPDKEKYIEFHGGYKPDNIRYATGMTIAGGSATTGFASGFAELSWACPAIWFGMGWVFQRVYFKTLYSRDLRFNGYFIGFAVAAIYAITQDLLTAETNLMFSLIPLAVTYRMARVQSHETLALQPA